MNTYVQDETIPIYISLQYDKNFLKFPINPDNLTKDRQSNSKTVEIDGIGEISVPSTPSLATITIKSFFWQDVNLLPSALYVAWLEKWQESKKTAKLIVTRLNYSMEVTCESFKHWINAGEEKDIYFELQLKEYRPYGAKKLNKITTTSILERLNKLKDDVMDYVSILIDVPRPSRNSSTKEKISNPYIVKENETISSITKKITGSTEEWKLLYDENTEILAYYTGLAGGIKPGIKLTLPQSWVENSTYNIEDLS